jgi:DNA replication and repair protein RecF
MHVLNVALTNFRNYRHLEVALTPGTTLLCGSNAAGKSSFLEALAMLATTRSPRASAEREVIHWDTPTEMGVPPFARLAARVQRREGPLTVDLVVQRQLDAQGQLTGRCAKRFQVNRRPVRAREAAGRLQAVLFEPEDLNLITGSPTRRRHYLDTTLMQADTRYWQALQRYQRVVLQRNQLLRRWQAEAIPPSAREQVATWNREMVQNGAYLIVARQRLLATLNPLLQAVHGRLSGAPQRFAMTYLHQVPCNPEEDEESVAYAFRQALGNIWPRELERGQTLLGPHRDDLGFFLGEMDLATYGSRGQQRTATIALKLAQVEWLRQQGGEAPVVLLDDVLSELDPERRGALQGWLLEGGCQVIVTTTDPQVFQPVVLAQATVYRVEAGQWAQQG